MKTRAWKLLALVLALALVLTGCNLIEVDPEKDNAEVVASVNDEKITAFDRAFTVADFQAGDFIIKKGKKTFHRVVVK